MNFADGLLEEFLNAYIDGCGLAGDQKGPLFRTIARGRGELTTTPQPQANAYTMIGRRAAGAGIETKIGNHTFRATGLSKCCGIQHGHKTVNFDCVLFIFAAYVCRHSRIISLPHPYPLPR